MSRQRNLDSAGASALSQMTALACRSTSRGAPASPGGALRIRSLQSASTKNAPSLKVSACEC